MTKLKATHSLVQMAVVVEPPKASHHAARWLGLGLVVAKSFDIVSGNFYHFHHFSFFSQSTTYD